MRLPRVRFTIGRIMVAVALVAVALVTLRSTAFVIHRPATKAPPIVLADGTIATTKPVELGITWLGVALMAAVIGVAVLAAAWLARLLLRAARPPVPPESR